MDTKKLRQKILDLAIHGRLVKQDPNDEPASVLLQRIREEKERLVHEGKIKRPKKAKAASDAMTHGNEVPFEVPSSWEWTTVEDFSSIVTDFVASGSFASLRENVKYYKIKEYAVLVRTIDFSNHFEGDLIYTDKHGYEFLSNSNLFGGELILPNIGASIGKVFIVPKLPCRMTLAPNSIMIKFVDEIYKLWTYNFFLSSIGQMALTDISSSSAQGKFNKTDLKKILIPLPPLPEQHRIVKEVGRWFALIDKIEQGKADLQAAVKQAKAKILDLAIHGKLVPQNPSDEPASELLRRINPAAACENGACGKLPSGWAVTTIKDSFLLLSGQDFPPEKYNDREEGIPYITGASNIVQGKLIINRWTTSPSVKSYCDDILVVCKGSVGEMTLNDVGEIHIARQIQAIRDIHHIVKIEYLKAVVSYNITDIVSKANGLIPGLRRDLLLSLSIPLPPLPEQHRIVAKIEELFAQLDSIQSSLITAV